MAIRKLDLYDLLAPQFMLGFSFPDYIDRYLRLLGIDEFQTSYDDDLILYTGSVVVNGAGDGAATFTHEEPTGSQLVWNGNRFRFRLTVSRDAAPLINDSITNPAPASGSTLAQLTNLFQVLRPAGEAATDPIAHPTPATIVTEYPGFAFKLELLLDLFSFSLGSDWVPGQLDPVSHRLVPDTSPEVAGKRVKIIMPRAVFQFQQGSDLSQPPAFIINSWGSVGLDTPNDLLVGEVVRMEPPIALHQGGHFGFSVDQLIIDASKETTPPEILEHFGTSEDFTGIFVRQMLIYYSNEQGIGFNFRVNDALISFAGEVSLEGALDIYLNTQLTTLSVETKIYEGPRQKTFRHGVIEPPASPPTVTSPPSPPGQAVVALNAAIQVTISGGLAPYTVRVYRTTTDIWNTTSRQAVLDTAGTDVPVLIYVEDAAGRKFAEYLRVTVQQTINSALPGGNGTASDRPAESRRNPATLSPPAGDVTTDRTMLHSDAGSGTVETLRVAGDRDATVTIRNGATIILTRSLTAGSREVSVDLPHGASYDVQVAYTAVTPASNTPRQDVRFRLDRPYTDVQTAAHIHDIQHNDDGCGDNPFLESYPAVRDYLTAQLANIASLQVDGYASLNDPGVSHDQQLSENRRAVVLALLSHIGYTGPITGSAHGNTNLPDPGNPGGAANRSVVILITYRTDPPRTITATLARPALPPQPITTPTPQPTSPTPAAPPPPNRRPDVLKRLGVRIRLERNALVLLELSGEIDFETEMENTLRNAGAGSQTDQLNLQNGGGNPNPQDGIVNFKVIYSYNTATREYGITFVLGAHPDDRDGLLHMSNAGGAGSDRFKNIFGALLLFAPIINSSAVATANNSQDAGNWIALGVSLAVPVAIGGLNIFRMRRAVLYGAEMITKFTVPTASQPFSSDVGLVFDYGVEFDIVAESLGIGLDRNVPNPTAPPMKVRYKAVGFNLHQDGAGLTYIPVFDSSRGYDLDLSDPSIFRLPDPLGNLLGVTAARLARFNPVTLEVDMALKFDLGVITVDRFKIKIPLDPLGPPMIMPSGVKVNIPGVIVGNGFVVINDTDVTQDDGSVIRVKGIEGGLDLTLVSLKIRAVGNVGISMLRDTTSGREGIGLFLGLRVDFPTPLVLGSSGLGLYGLSGLFAMHYKRLEDPRVPQDPVGPALKWLIKAEGEPYKLFNSTNQRLWGPNFDRWSFGVGVILGTMDAGITANFQGMFILELPGPRILIMVKMKFISVRPASVNQNASQLNTGILAVIDIDLGRQQITIGVMIDFSIERVLEIRIPVELFFKYDDPGNWHFWLGTLSVPASANILNMVRGSAYFMIQGNDFTYPASLPHVPDGAPILGLTLNGVAIALGLEASLLFGSEEAGLYLRIGAGFHVGVSFTPFVLVGSMFFEGTLRLFIVSIGADGHLDVLITRREGEPFYIFLHGQVCGRVSFFFFSISACIDITIEEGTKHIDAPELLRGIYLQSNAPVLVSGQGGDKPIDATLGNALPGAVDVTDPKLWVPIDTVPVLQFQYSPDVAGLTTFTAPVGLSPDYRAPGGWIELNKETKVRYTLKTIQLTEANGMAYSSPTPVPATWRVERTNGESLQNGARTNVDLALFSRSPTTAERAIERSTQLRKTIGVRWNNVCKPAADPASVLFTFCDQLLGPAAHGWNLVGVPLPDGPDTVRVSQPNVAMHVEGFDYRTYTAWDYLVQETGSTHATQAQVVGTDSSLTLSRPARKTCVKLSELTPEERKRLSASLLIGQVKRLSSLPNPLVNPDGPNLQPVFSADLVDQLDPAKLGKLGNIQGVLLGGSVGFFMVRPICLVELTLVVDSPDAELVVTAYNARKQKLDSVSLTFDRLRVGVPVLAMLEAKNVTLVLVKIRNGKGVLTNLCIQPCPPGKSPGGNCFRALEAPHCRQIRNQYGERVTAELADQKISDKLKEYQTKTERPTYVTFTTEVCDFVLVYAAFDAKQQTSLFVQELDASGAVLKQHKFTDLITQTITTFATELPGTWRDAARPWRERVFPISQFLFSSRFNEYTKCLLELKPKETCTKVRFVLNCGQRVFRPALYIGAIERLQTIERQQQGEVTVIQQTDQDTLSGYLNSAGSSPLLKPNTLYRLSVSYDATVETRNANGSVDTDTVSPPAQVFSFRTDNRPPRELKPYVLTASPDLDDKFHFFDDPVKVVFNDNAILKLYETYGRQLRAIIRAADGAPVTNSPDTLTALELTPATVNSPYYDLVMELIRSGDFRCIGGAVSFQATYTTPFKLKPLMSYTFDIDPSPTDPLPPGTPVLPLFRRAFTTSRYADLDDFVTSIRELLIRQSALTGPVTGLPTPVPIADSPRTDVVTTTDLDLQNTLVAVGYKPTPGREQTGLTLFWIPRAGGGFRPYAVLIDAAEPTWRLRSEPKKKLVRDGLNRVIDPAFEIWEPGVSLAMELLEPAGSSLVRQYVRATAGTRTLVLLRDDLVPAAAGTPFSLEIRQTPSALLGLSDKRRTLFMIRLDPKAPWEE